jgi:hypothetical protein
MSLIRCSPIPRSFFWGCTFGLHGIRPGLFWGIRNVCMEMSQQNPLYNYYIPIKTLKKEKKSIFILE